MAKSSTEMTIGNHLRCFFMVINQRRCKACVVTLAITLGTSKEKLSSNNPVTKTSGPLPGLEENTHL